MQWFPMVSVGFPSMSPTAPYFRHALHLISQTNSAANTCSAYIIKRDHYALRLNAIHNSEHNDFEPSRIIPLRQPTFSTSPHRR